MSKMRIYQEYTSFNKTNISTTPRKVKQKTNASIDSNSLNPNSIELNNKSNKSTPKMNKTQSKIKIKIEQESKTVEKEKEKEEQPKTPKEILSSLLKKTLGKSLLKLETNTKEQLNTLKFTGKYYIVFEKNLLLLKSGVEKKRKEDEKKQRQAKKNKTISTTTNRIRSRTVQNLRKMNSEKNLFNTERGKTNSKMNSMFFRKKNENNEDTPKIRSRTLKSSRYTSSKNLKKKNSKEISNTKVETPKREKINYGNNISNRQSLRNKNNINSKDKEKEKDKDNNKNNTTINRSRSRKNTLNNQKEKDTTDKPKRKNSIRRNSKKRLTKKKSKEEIKNNINIASPERSNSPIIIKQAEKSITNLIEEKNNNKNDDMININENININQIIDNKKKDNENNNNVTNVLKELEEFNEKKPKLEEDKKEKEKETNIKSRSRSRSRSRSKNTDKKDSESIDKEIKGSLNDVKLMIEGVSDVLDKINSEKKIKFEKKKKKIDGNSNENEKKLNMDENDENKIKGINKELFTEENKMKKNEEKEEEKNNNNNDCNINININTDNKNNNKEEEELSNKYPIISNDNKEENKDNIINKLKGNIKLAKESQIMNDEIMNTIENDKNILTNSLYTSFNIFSSNIEIGKITGNKDILNNINDNNINDNKVNNNNINDNKVNDNNINDNIIDTKEKDNNIISTDENNNNKILTDKEVKDKEKEKENIIDDNNNTNLINKLEEKIKEKEKNLNQEQKEVIKSESIIMHDEQLVNPNQSLDQSSFINQSSIMSQSAILAEQYVLISRDPDAPFSIEDALKFDKTQYLGILDYLNFEEKINFTGISRGFNIERIYLLNNKREDLIRSLELSPRETVEDLIIEIRLKYPNIELTKSFNEFQIARGGAKAVELLNNDLYSKLFKKPMLEKNSEEICIVYRVLFALFGEYEIANIYGDQLFWIRCTEYMIKNSNGKIGTFILDKFKGITFEHKKIFLLNKLLVGMKKKINPNYFSKICGTTGLLIFLIKDTLEYCGVIINDKKTQPARILDNLLYYKNSIDTLAQYIDFLSGIKTYRVREKKDKENK